MEALETVKTEVTQIGKRLTFGPVHLSPAPIYVMVDESMPCMGRKPAVRISFQGLLSVGVYAAEQFYQHLGLAIDAAKLEAQRLGLTEQ